MNSKILIDWNEVPMITVKLPLSMEYEVGSDRIKLMDVSSLDDPRDKLAHVFIHGGPFAIITNVDSGEYHIHSMNALDVMQNILNIYGQMFRAEGPKLMGSEYTDRKDFEQAVFKVCSMIESVSGERSTVFKEKVDAQALSNVSFNGEKQCPKCLTDSVG